MKVDRSSSLDTRHITAVHRDYPGAFEHLLDYESIHYHLLLEFNHVQPESLENVKLKNLYDIMSYNDDDAINTAIYECLDELWPFMKVDFASRSLKTPSSKRTIRLQALTVNGVLRVKPHNRRLKIPGAKPVDNLFSDVPVFQSADIERLAHDSTNCMNTIYCQGRQIVFVTMGDTENYKTIERRTCNST